MALLPMAIFLFYEQMRQNDCRNKRQRGARKTTTVWLNKDGACV
jgi:hypothetical protein